jgi:hypothetical protein
MASLARRKRDRLLISVVVAASVLTACGEHRLTAILPAVDAPASGQGGAGGGGGGAGGMGGTVSKIVGLVVHDDEPTRAALWSVRSDFEIGALGAHPWLDWPNTYILSADPGAMLLLGKDWIAVAAESKQYIGGPQATLTLGSSADLYMPVDDRWVMPTWTAGWVDTGWNMIVWESITRPSLPFSIFGKAAASGSIDLPLIGGTIGYNYFIIVN